MARHNIPIIFDCYSGAVPGMWSKNSANVGTVGRRVIDIGLLTVLSENAAKALYCIIFQ